MQAHTHVTCSFPLTPRASAESNTLTTDAVDVQTLPGSDDCLVSFVDTSSSPLWRVLCGDSTPLRRAALGALINAREAAGVPWFARLIVCGPEAVELSKLYGVKLWVGEDFDDDYAAWRQSTDFETGSPGRLWIDLRAVVNSLPLQYVNLTARPICVRLAGSETDTITIPPSGVVYVVSAKQEICTAWNRAPGEGPSDRPIDLGNPAIASLSWGEISGLPAPVPGVRYIVPWAVAVAAGASRVDLLVEGPRDERSDSGMVSMALVQAHTAAPTPRSAMAAYTPAELALIIGPRGPEIIAAALAGHTWPDVWRLPDNVGRPKHGPCPAEEHMDLIDLLGFDRVAGLFKHWFGQVTLRSEVPSRIDYIELVEALLRRPHTRELWQTRA